MANIPVAIGFVGLAGVAGLLIAWESLTDETDTHLPVNTANLTFPLANYNTMADTLQAALGDPTALIHFPDMTQVNSTFAQLQNADDLKALINAFGVRDRDFFGVSFLTLWEGSLTQYLTACLEEDELNPIKAKFTQLNVGF